MFAHNIEVFLTASNIADDDVRGRTVVAMDVLRASTTIIHALAAGAREVIPVPDMGEAGRIAAALDPASYVLGGEKDGKPIEGYGLGNSPLDYSGDAVSGKTVILSTTNGTPAILAAAEADDVLVGGFVNINAVADAVRALQAPLTIVCAGWKNRVALEDTMCAGMLIDLLLEGHSPANLADTAYMALWQYRHDQDAIDVPIGRCNHARRLEQLGHGADVAESIRIDAVPVVPHLSERRLVPWSAADPTLSSGESSP
ncbi:MAG: 2-phosphosulfolactate phosphatase [Rhodothermales bacterium]|nr:2-phosphosulfolactate phosphatase [Rhodothermales bacterium]MBO6779857.1 2-phosphosulfolactate phosphatase [Rhodothermales bacterium]